MGYLKISDVQNYVKNNIGSFHSKRIQSLKELKLNGILKRKNPYLYKAKNINIASELVINILNAHLSSQEEGLFGDFLEGLAIYINNIVYNGQKSAAEGIDLEFEDKGIKYIVSIKSGPNWGNSSQIKKLIDCFVQAKRILRTNNKKLVNIVAVNGCCYGKDNSPDKGQYLKYCGQEFWEFISGNTNLYTQIIEPLGYKAMERNNEFNKSYGQIVNNFTDQFMKEFCYGGLIDWEKLVRFNSQRNN
jgi:regulator of sigma D